MRNAFVEVSEDIPDSVRNALDGVIEAEQQATMRVALAELPERQRAAIALFHFEGLSGRESAQALSLSESAFDSLLTRARLALTQRVSALRGNGEA
jgi:RNA polymerase sigma-70 factor (ECF subfamily)